ncbi:YjiH family protein [Corynebacterium lizhenjunii]|uniref:YjiH family protein n=1 Tax=Corynebacterium lizhenjunii TaxID=2709394 RepID=A0A7T0KDM0_9CORY|nr:YjiH family protein [Corynebacterium lizhenjunii]QPK78569.1 YjiH family protein [Corynebacterium lizhenjunii]
MTTNNSPAVHSAAAAPGTQPATGSWRFFVYSAIGIFAFFVPFTVGETNSILLDHLVKWISALLGSATPWVVYAILVAGTVYPFVTGRFRKSPARLAFALLGVAGLVVATMLMFNFGPALVFEDRIGPFLYNKLVIPVGLLVPVGAIFLAFLVSFGLMEFVGVLVQKFMRPVFHTPGRSAIDAVASFVGSYSLGLLVTDRTYKSGGYTAREAAIIAAGFSTASATFMVVIARTLDLMPIWGPYFFTTLIVCFLVSAIIVRIPPLSRIPDDPYPGVELQAEEVVSSNRIQAAWREATKTLNSCPPLWRVLWENLRDGFQMTMQILPGIMSVGFLGLVLAYYTPLFKILGFVFWPVTHLLGLPEPQLAQEALAIGLSELFLPATLVADSGSEMLRFLIAVVSVSQVFFFSSMVPAVLATEIPLKIWHMVVIWFLRVVLSLVLAFPFALVFTS